MALFGLISNKREQHSRSETSTQDNKVSTQSGVAAGANSMITIENVDGGLVMAAESIARDSVDLGRDALSFGSDVITEIGINSDNAFRFGNEAVQSMADVADMAFLSNEGIVGDAFDFADDSQSQANMLVENAMKVMGDTTEAVTGKLFDFVHQENQSEDANLSETALKYTVPAVAFLAIALSVWGSK